VGGGSFLSSRYPCRDRNEQDIGGPPRELRAGEEEAGGRPTLPVKLFGSALPVNTHPNGCRCEHDLHGKLPFEARNETCSKKNGFLKWRARFHLRGRPGVPAPPPSRVEVEIVPFVPGTGEIGHVPFRISGGFVTSQHLKSDSGPF